METKGRKKIRVVGINRTRDLSAYAARIETEMNRLMRRRYTVSLRDEPNGVLIIAQYVEAEDVQLPPGVHLVKLDLEPESTTSARTKELVRRFALLKSPEVMVQEARSCFHGYTAPELEVAASEIAECLKRHEETCKSGSCRAAPFYKTILGLVKDAQRLSLQ
jgi:hypothetical protein